jgi:hypothetical protein
MWFRAGKLVKSLKDINTCPRVHYEAHHQLFTAARELDGLDKEALEPLRAIDERAYVSIDPVHQRLQSLWLSAPSWLVRNLTLSICIFTPYLQCHFAVSYWQSTLTNITIIVNISYYLLIS